LPMVIAVNTASPYRTLGDLLGAARAKPGTLTLASVGPGTVSHVAFEKLKRVANVDMTFVPYPGNAPAMNALLGAHVTAAFADYAVLAEQIKAGKLRALATASRTRIEWLPDVPTISESGYTDFAADYWLGLFAPAKTPKETVSRLAGRFTAAMQVLVAKGTLTALGLFPVGICGSDFGAFLHKQYDEYGRAIRESGIKAE
jgi:tripartite-type tricarboxylate transporter receptor subunit TctC